MMTSNVELIQKLQHDKYDAELGGEIEDILRTGGLTWQGETMSVRINDAMNAIKEGISVGLSLIHI